MEILAHAPTLSFYKIYNTHNFTQQSLRDEACAMVLAQTPLSETGQTSVRLVVSLTELSLIHTLAHTYPLQQCVNLGGPYKIKEH